MRIFHSELTANPAHYSFGYSVYAELEAGDMLDGCYEKGFLPFVGARKQEPRLLYMARGARVRVPEFAERHYHARVRRRVAEVLPEGITGRVYARDAHPNLPAVTDFFLSYFAFRFGKGAMPRERLEAIVHGPFVSHIVEYRSGDICIGYTLEVQTDTLIHVWYQAYAREYASTHLGIALYLELLARAKKEGKQFLYFGVTYGAHMAYKTNFEPLECWNGRAWVGKSAKEWKQLLREDSTRLLAFVDEWRVGKGAYYPAPYPFTSGLAELRYFALFAIQHRRIFGMYVLLLGLLLAIAFAVASL
jgi:hypothetical protein